MKRKVWIFLMALIVLLPSLTAAETKDPPVGYEPGRIRGVVESKTIVRETEPTFLPDGSTFTPRHIAAEIRLNREDLESERDRIRELRGHLAGMQASSEQVDAIHEFDLQLEEFDRLLGMASPGCTVLMIQRTPNTTISRASWFSPCSGESDPVSAQWWEPWGVAYSYHPWGSTTNCVFNPSQYLWVETDAPQMAWYTDLYSIATSTGPPTNCVNRDHSRMWWALGDGIYQTFGTPHREILDGAGHTVTSWQLGRDKLVSDWASQQYQGGAHSCGWVWAGWYKGLYLGCGVEMWRN